MLMFSNFIQALYISVINNISFNIVTFIFLFLIISLSIPILLIKYEIQVTIFLKRLKIEVKL